MADDNHVPPPKDGHTAIGGQAHRVDADGGGVERQVGIAHRVVADGVGIDLCRLPDFAVVTHRIGVVPILALVTSGCHPTAKAYPHHPGLVINLALDVAAGELAVVVGADVELAASERGGGDLQRAGADGRRRDAPHRRIDRVGGDGSGQRLQGQCARRCLLDGDDAGLVVDRADARRRPGGTVEAPVDFTAAVKVGFLADDKAYRAGDDALGQGRQQVDAQHAAGCLFCPRVLRLRRAETGAHHKALVNGRGGERLDVLVTGKHHAVERFDRLRRPLRGDNLLAHRLLAVDGFGDFDDRVRLKFDDAGRVVNRATADATGIAQRARTVIAHRHIGVDLTGVGLARLYFGVVVLDQYVVGEPHAARLDVALAEVKVDVAAAVTRRRFPLGLLRLADAVINLDVQPLLAAGKAGEGDVATAVIDRPRPRAGDVTRAVVLRRFGGTVVRPA